MESTSAAGHNESLSRTAVLLAAATLLAWAVLVAMDHDGAGWLVQPVLGLAAVVTAWRAGGRSPQNRGAFVALIIGSLAVLSFLAFVITDA
jgi:hypothetical protein